MSEIAISKSEAIVLIDERIRQHDEATNEPKHSENKALIKGLTDKMDIVVVSLTKIETTANLVMKFAVGGLVVWTVRQVAELVKILH